MEKQRDILDEIVAAKRIEVADQMKAVPSRELFHKVEELLANGITRHSMRAALAASPSGIIAEFKRKSPSKGWIHEDAEVDKVVVDYEMNGASALSILTDEQFFGGQMRFISRVRSSVNIPILRKDFIIDEYQLYQSRMIGADAVLLIAACLTPEQCRMLTLKAHELELETLLEIHSEAELAYVTDDIDMVGVNNRNLGTFHTDVQNSFRLAGLLPNDKLLVSESGISDTFTLQRLREVGFRGFLIGETFMKTPDPGATLRELISNI
jgi:indole-3-glycerol phosphate synthase